MLIIRSASPSDIGAVDSMLARSYGPLLRADYPPSILVVALPRMARAQPGLLASGRYFVAERDGMVVGAGGWSPENPRGGPVRDGLGHVRHVATDAREIRHGVGRAVMARVLDDAGRAGMLRLSALSTLTAVPFYAALGFREVGRLSLSFGTAISFPAVEMMREL
ncbi:GNAT family N-acetyltransferase [Rubellimicrobium rubrum]|uniref:GNAT family N-acetyltransferase n=1 Tax=Rubellimicrobium rubrum TaxID=2585369 RepID=A0A5C4N1Y6_9RHOB|nr:GNAT family N-acetyltransferase [Rubellimicrobium rubrum]TNC51844.1 GNAT family N-acetyltransferase [Rubellimicrobium rubrum]